MAVWCYSKMLSNLWIVFLLSCVVSIVFQRKPAIKDDRYMKYGFFTFLYHAKAGVSKKRSVDK